MKEIFERANQYLFFIILMVAVLYYGKPFLVPLVFGAMLAMLMAPMCRRFERWGFNRALATLGCILILVFVIAGIAFVVSTQFATFMDHLSQIQAKAGEMLTRAQAWIQEQIGVSPAAQEKIVREQAEQSGQSGPGLASRILAAVTSTLTGIVLTMVVTFLMIYNKEQFETFFIRLYDDQDPEKVRTVVGQIAQVAQKYLTGRAMSVLIIATLYSIGLLIVGIRNAVLLGGIAALLTVIPYLGTVLGGLFPVLMALLTQDVETALWAAVVMIAIQTIDNYFIEPNVVGGEVNLNAMWSILSIIAGGMIWGVAGMIVFLPLFGIIKIVFDHVQPLKPLGFILGNGKGRGSGNVIDWLKLKVGIRREEDS